MASPRRPRILFLTTDYPPDLGGLQTYSHRVVRDLPPGLLSRVVVGSDHSPGALLRPDGLDLRVRRGKGRLRAFAWSLREVLTARLTGHANATLHMQWSTAAGPWLLRRLGLGRPYVILVHGAELLDPGRSLLNRAKASILAGADAVVAGSHATADLYLRLGLHSRRLEVIPYGNPLETLASPASRPAASPTPPIRLLCMHRLVPRKGTALLLEALADLKTTAWTLTVVGRGEEETALRARARALGLEERVTFRPPVGDADKPALFAAADVFVLPSLPPEDNNHMEGLGLTLLEAQGQGVPVLAARTGGIPEALDEERTGLLFAAGDAVDLREKLQLLLGDSDLRFRLGAAGPTWVRERFDWGKSLARLGRLLEEVAGGG